MTQAGKQADDQRKNIADIYPLSPMQEGILFHSISDPHSGQYMPQTAMRITGEINGDLLRSIWQKTIDRHSVLRSGFYWEERDTPFQIVFKNLPVSWIELDWSNRDEARHSELLPESLSGLFEANRQEPFNLRQPPLMRIQWIRMGPCDHILVMCYHHIILDGWSVQQVLDDALALYCHETGHRTAVMPMARPYGDYIGWLKTQDRDTSSRFWRDYLSGSPGSTRFVRDDSTTGFNRFTWDCPEDLFQAVKTFCSNSGCTLNSVLQGALALLIGQQTERQDLMFGTATSGRPGTLAGSTTMIGLFINTLPVRVTIDPDRSLTAWITDLQKRQATTIDHEYIPLRDIQGSGASLFDTLLVVENFSTNSEHEDNLPFRATPLTFDERTHFPLTIWAIPQTDSLSILVGHNPDMLSKPAIEAMMTAVADILSNMMLHAEKPLADHLARIERLPSSSGFADRRDQLVSQSMSRKRVSQRQEKSLEEEALSQTESLLVRVWSSLLKTEFIGRQANFFELGGHSLLAARVVSRLRTEFAIEIPVRTLFERPVLGELAAHIDELRTGSGSDPDIIEVSF